MNRTLAALALTFSIAAPACSSPYKPNKMIFAGGDFTRNTGSKILRIEVYPRDLSYKTNRDAFIELLTENGANIPDDEDRISDLARRMIGPIRASLIVRYPDLKEALTEPKETKPHRQLEHDRLLP
jgi:hypothetical protein